MEQSSEVSSLMQRFLSTFGTGDTSFLELLSRDESLTVIGTDPKEWMVGFDEAARVMSAQTEEIREAGIKLNMRDFHAFQDGSIGWGAGRMAFQLPDGSDLPGRFTVVARRENGDWKIVQVHASIGFANEQALGEELTV